MAYQVYTTSAYVCGSFDRNTSDRHYYLFTREAGMILASARSVREERSKHRFALQEFSCVDVSLIRGKRDWKVTGTKAQRNLYFATDDRQKRGVILRITQLVQRFIRGEECDSALYDYLLSGLYDLIEDHEHAPALYEQVLTLKTLSALGYVAPHPLIDAVIACDSAREACAKAHSREVNTQIKSVIEHAFYVSDL